MQRLAPLSLLLRSARALGAGVTRDAEGQLWAEPRETCRRSQAQAQQSHSRWTSQSWGPSGLRQGARACSPAQAPALKS